MSPAQSHVEQSRNTLLFASCAKQVSTSAQVNVVMSEKALVKQLQRELARLEAHLKSLQFPSSSCDSVKEKELVIEKVTPQISVFLKYCVKRIMNIRDFQNEDASTLIFD